VRHDLTPDIVEQLVRQHEEDLARTRAMYSTPWPLYTNVQQFEEQPSPSRRWRRALWISVGLWLLGCVSLGPVVEAVENAASKLPLAGPIRSIFGGLK
jgi:hypothetical protein